MGGDDVKLVRCMLPPYFKNRKAMQRKKAGYPINHVKDETTVEAFVVMVVIARRIMRKLLAKEWQKKEEEMKSEKESALEIDAMKIITRSLRSWTRSLRRGKYTPLSNWGIFTSSVVFTQWGFRTIRAKLSAVCTRRGGWLDGVLTMGWPRTIRPRR